MLAWERLVDISSLNEGKAQDLLLNIVEGNSIESIGAKVIYVNTAPINLGTGSVMCDMYVDEVEAEFTKYDRDTDIELVDLSADVISEEE